jgi:hypothetical protein
MNALFSIENIFLSMAAIACIVLFFQDLRKRAIHIVPLILLGLGGFGYHLQNSGTNLWMEIFVNLGYVTLVLVVMTLILRLRSSSGRILNKKIGLGDILFFYVVALAFDPLGYTLWFVTGLITVLLGVLAWMILGKWRSDAPIPLAGLLAGYLLVYFPVYTYLEDRIWALAGSWMG